MHSKPFSVRNPASSTNSSISNAEPAPYFCYGGGFKNCQRVVDQCVKLCSLGDSKQAVTKLSACMEKHKDDFRVNKYNKGSIDLFLAYKEAALVFTFGYINSRAKSYIQLAKELSQNFQFCGNEIHFIHIYNLYCEIQVRDGEISEAEASIKQVEEFIKDYKLVATTPANKDFIIRSRSWNQLHKALIFLEKKKIPEAINQVARAIKGFEQVNVERLIALAKEVKVRIYVEWAKSRPSKLKQAEMICKEILKITFVEQEENHFYMKGRMKHHLAKISIMKKNLADAQKYSTEAKIQYELNLPKESKLVSDLTTLIENDVYDLYCDKLSLNEFPGKIEG